MERVVSADISSADFHPVMLEDLVAMKSRSRINRYERRLGQVG
jgi:hypothetical protein